MTRPLRTLAALGAAFLLAPLFAGARPARAPLRFAYRFTPGKAVRYRIRADVKLAAAGDPDPVTANATLVYRINAQRATSTGATPLDLAYDSVDIELLGQPLGLSDAQARKTFNKRITLSRLGDIHRASVSPPSAASLYVPGLDPGALYSLMFPVVFPAPLVRLGQTWTYHSPLLGTSKTPATFVARYAGTVLSGGSGRARRLAEVRTRFTMNVDIAINKEGKPAAKGEEAMITRKGRIDGTGVYLFDPARGRLDHGTVELQANMNETHVTADPSKPPETVRNTVDAKIALSQLTAQPVASDAAHPR